MSKKFKKTKIRAYERAQECNRKTKKAISKLSKATSAQITVLNSMFGIGDAAMHKISMADTKARAHLIDAFWKVLDQLWDNTPEGRQWYLLTLFDDMVTMSDREPALHFHAFTDKVSAAVRRLGLQGISVFEQHPIINYPQKGEGRTILGHMHAICFTDAPFDQKGEEKYLNHSGHWQCKLGAKPININLLPTKEDLLAAASYVLKHPHSAKNLRQDRDKWSLMDTRDGYRTEFHLRCLELLSHISFSRGIVAVGKEGRAMKSAIMGSLSKWHKIRLKQLGPRAIGAHYSTANFWVELRKENGSQNFLPFKFVGQPETKPRRRRRPPRPSTPEQRALRKTMLARRRQNSGNITPDSASDG